MASPLLLERTMADLKTARLVVHKLGETVDNFPVNSYSIFTLVNQWRSCQASFDEIHNSLEIKVKELECKERDIGVVANKLHCFRDEVELRQKMLEDGERSLSEKIKEVELRQNEVKKWLELIEAQKRGINERLKVVDAKERELLERVKKVDEDEIRVRKAELEVFECRRVVELEKSRLAELAKEFESREEQIDERCKKVELRANVVDERCKKVELRESVVDERCKKAELRENLVDERCKKAELRENVVDERCKKVQLRENVVDERCKELELREREIKEHGEDLESVERKIKDREEALEVEETGLDEKKQVVVAKEMRLMKDHQALELREHELDDLQSLLELREIEIDETLKGVESKEKELMLREEEMKVKHEDLKSKEKDIIEHLNRLNVKEGDLKENCRALEDKANEIYARFASLAAREVEIIKRSRDVETKEIQVSCIQLDVNGMRSYMCMEEDNVLHDKILNALRSAPDPAGLVLDISKSFFETGSDEVENNAIRTRCIYLLELLAKLSPSITRIVEYEAREFAAFWRQRLNGATPISIFHFGYLHFLAAFKLAKSYKTEILLSFFKTSYLAAKLYPPEKNVDLCCALGVQDKIPDFVRSLIQRQKHLEAVKCISLLKLECDFPPVPLVEAYLELVKQKLDEKLNRENFLGKVDATATELSHLRCALASIRNLKLDLILPTDSLSLRIKELEEIKAKRMAVKSSRKRYAFYIGTPTVQLEKRPRTESRVSPCPPSWSFN